MSMEVTHTRLLTGSGQKVLHHELYFESSNMVKTKQATILKTRCV